MPFRTVKAAACKLDLVWKKFTTSLNNLQLCKDSDFLNHHSRPSRQPNNTYVLKQPIDNWTSLWYIVNRTIMLGPHRDANGKKYGPKTDTLSDSRAIAPGQVAPFVVGQWNRLGWKTSELVCQERMTEMVIYQRWQQQRIVLTRWLAESEDCATASMAVSWHLEEEKELDCWMSQKKNSSQRMFNSSWERLNEE